MRGAVSQADAVIVGADGGAGPWLLRVDPDPAVSTQIEPYEWVRR